MRIAKALTKNVTIFIIIMWILRVVFKSQLWYMVHSLNFSAYVQLLILVLISLILKYMHGMVVTIVYGGINNVLILLEFN